ncbi:hypothetical protein IJ101_00150 [Candidatus Saccharibacteria bacterium]|nr:hypothetical protein [Candidatus Saccharibacteria bacterium]
MRTDKFGIIIEANANPDSFELKVATILIEYFASDIIIKKSLQSYSPDLLVTRTNQLWEIKNIRGNGIHTIEHNLSKAKLQSDKIVISLYRTKMPPARAIGRIKAVLKKGTTIKQVILITKSGKIIKIK